MFWLLWFAICPIETRINSSVFSECLKLRKWLENNGSWNYWILSLLIGSFLLLNNQLMNARNPPADPMADHEPGFANGAQPKAAVDPNDPAQKLAE